jgi:hypothetical protein
VIRSFALLWTFGVLSIIASIAAGLASADVHVVLRIVVGIVACVVAIAACAREKSYGVGLVLGVASFVVVMAQSADFLRAHTGDHVTISVAEARDHASAATFHFTDGDLDTSHIGAALTFSAGKSSYSKYLTCAAPIVAREGEPVAAWGIILIEGVGICQRVYFSEAESAWRAGRREAVAVERIERDDATRAVADAKLVSVPGAPTVVLEPEGLAVRAARADHHVILWLAWMTGLWTLAIAVIATRKKSSLSG